MNRSLRKDMTQGAVAFAMVGVAAFSVWAFAAPWFRHWGGEPAMFSAIALVFLVASGQLMGGLAGGVAAFYRQFLPAFLSYALVWCTAWFAVGGRAGEWVGAGLGCLIFATFMMGKSTPPSLRLRAVLVLFVLHTIGYFAGDAAMHEIWLPRAKLLETSDEERKLYLILAKLSWGVCYGLGFGAGIGWLFHHAKTPCKSRIET